MHYLLVGSGRVGRTLASELLEKNHSVCLIDRNPKALENITPHKNLSTITGVGFDKDILEAARIKESFGLAAVTNGDNSNIVIARIAKDIFNVENVVARIYDPKRANLYHRLGISTIVTVSWSAKEIMKKIAPENGSLDWVDSTGEIIIVEKSLPSIWAGKSLNNLFKSENYSPIAWTHLGESNILKLGTKGQEDARIYFSCLKDKIGELDTALSDPEFNPQDN